MLRIHKTVLSFTFIWLTCVLAAGCATIGQRFPVYNVPDIEIGKTTRADIRKWFGAPWRTGIENGKRSWTYGYYQYALFHDARTTDLVIRFDHSGKVVSYAYNTNVPEHRIPDSD